MGLSPIPVNLQASAFRWPLDADVQRLGSRLGLGTYHSKGRHWLSTGAGRGLKAMHNSLLRQALMCRGTIA